jgi:hypothetical protein
VRITLWFLPAPRVYENTMRNYGKVMPHQLKGPPPQDTGGRGVESNNRPRVHSGMTLYVSLGFVKTSAVHFQFS